MNQLRGQSVLVLGLGETGLSLARWLCVQGARLRVADSRTEPPGVATLAQQNCRRPMCIAVHSKTNCCRA